MVGGLIERGEKIGVVRLERGKKKWRVLMRTPLILESYKVRQFSTNF